MNFNDIATTNPEELFEEEGVTSDSLFNGSVSEQEREEARHILNEAAVADIGRLLADYQKDFTPDLNQHLVNLMTTKVWDATPDQLEDIVQEAKAAGRHVWEKVRILVMRRNEMEANKVNQCNNLEALDNLLASLAKQDGWLPAPVYHTVKSKVRELIYEASMVELDAISEFAGKWRIRGALLPDIKARDAELIRSVSRYEKVSGYVLKSQDRRIILENVRKAIRLSETMGWKFVD